MYREHITWDIFASWDFWEKKRFRPDLNSPSKVLYRGMVKYNRHR